MFPGLVWHVLWPLSCLLTNVMPLFLKLGSSDCNLLSWVLFRFQSKGGRIEKKKTYSSTFTSQLCIALWYLIVSNITRHI